MSRPAERRVTKSELGAATLEESRGVELAMRRGVHDARARNRRLGMPNVSVRDGRIVEELADGSVRPVDPTTRQADAPERRAG